jgi:hypothetical protein
MTLFVLDADEGIEYLYYLLTFAGFTWHFFTHIITVAVLIHSALGT